MEHGDKTTRWLSAAVTMSMTLSFTVSVPLTFAVTVLPVTLSVVIPVLSVPELADPVSCPAQEIIYVTFIRSFAV